MRNTAESTSPILSFDWSTYFWRDEEGCGWVCSSALDRLFYAINREGNIRLFSSRKPRKDAYRCQLVQHGDYTSLPEIHESFYIVYDLKRWLRAQIGAGRPHIGVELL